MTKQQLLTLRTLMQKFAVSDDFSESTLLTNYYIKDVAPFFANVDALCIKRGYVAPLEDGDSYL